MPACDTDYERTDADPRLLAWLATALVAVVVVLASSLRLAFPQAAQQRAEMPQLRPPAPRLQADPAADLAALRHAEDEQLASYGWVDRPNGVVRKWTSISWNRLNISASTRSSQSASGSR